MFKTTTCLSFVYNNNLENHGNTKKTSFLLKQIIVIFSNNLQLSYLWYEKNVI